MDDPEFQKFIPRYYLETLNYKNIIGGSEEARRIRYKDQLIGSYGGRKGYKVEERIKNILNQINEKTGIGYAQGASRIIDTNIDFAIYNGIR